MNTTLQTLMREATRLTQAGQLNEAAQTLQRALGAMASNRFSTSGLPTFAHGGAAPEAMPRAARSLMALDDCANNTDTFTGASYAHAGLTRRYKLYTPPRAATARPNALVVMLHGCTQNADDFAAGTNMNALAREQGCLVLYPEQSQEANPQRCWNWFKHNHQKRGSGEPALIASLTHLVAQKHGIDPRRVYIAGLSAGGAMAAVVATAYPDVFAAAGIHSGLPGSAAANVAEALMLMKSGGAKGGLGRASPAATPWVHQPVPTIVFHGDQDQTVHPRNGEHVLAAALCGITKTQGATQSAPHAAAVEQGVSQRGRRYTRSIYRDDADAPIAEHWVLHGAGHAWSGGLPSGSYTDPTGPDASREMLRFFFSQPTGRPQ